MSANSLLAELQDDSRPMPDFRVIRERVHDEFDVATSSEERGLLLAILKVAMDGQEVRLAGDDLLKFQKLRTEDRNILLIKECLVGTDVCPHRMLAATDREIAAGRMSETDELREIAKVGALAIKQPLGVNPPAAPKGFLKRFFGKS